MVNSIGQKQVRDAYVSRAEQNQTVQRADADRVRRAPQDRPAGEEASVQLSDGLRTIQHAVEQVRQAPDVRAERVQELRRQVEAGEYNVTSAQLAAKMLGKVDGGF
jgi:negative regulator of flagellin synthesis FlgM